MNGGRWIVLNSAASAEEGERLANRKWTTAAGDRDRTSSSSSCFFRMARIWLVERQPVRGKECEWGSRASVELARASRNPWAALAATCELVSDDAVAGAEGGGAGRLGSRCAMSAGMASLASWERLARNPEENWINQASKGGYCGSDELASVPLDPNDAQTSPDATPEWAAT